MKKLIINSKKYGNVEVMVDDADFDWISDYNWVVSAKKKSSKTATTASNNNKPHFNIQRTCLVNANDGTQKNKKKTLSLHREIMNSPKGSIVSHINGNTLDNRKENLRVVSKSAPKPVFKCECYVLPISETLEEKVSETKTYYGAYVDFVANKKILIGKYDSPDAAREALFTSNTQELIRNFVTRIS